MDIISSLAWIKRGAAKGTPIKFMPEPEELESMIDKSGDQDEEETTNEGEMDVEKRQEKDDQEDDENDIFIPGVGPIAMHASNRDDPLLEIKDDGEDSDAEDYFIRPDDNLIVAAHVEDDTSSLEVYIYNDKEGYLYVHHDILMLHMPLCLTWLDYDTNNSNTVNYVAVGSMEGAIEIFDVDLVDQMEPMHTFAKKSQKKKSKSSKNSSKKANKSSEGHDAAVLDLTWNKLVRQIFASSSADATIALWDLSQMKMALHLEKLHKKQIQSICWHPSEAQNLLSGSSDRTVCMVDCRDGNNKSSQHRWTFDSDIERVTWNTFDTNQFLTSTENGYVYAMDIRQTTIPVYNFSAHTGAVTGLCLNSSIPGLLVTSSFDECVKVWDVENNTVTFIAERQFPTGRINACLVNPDFPFTYAFGGQSQGLQIWDCSENSDVRTRFGTRAKFEMVEVAEEPAAAAAVSKPVVSSFPTTAPTVTSAVLKAQRKKSSKKNK
ncbi:unnamed protein product [Rotaria magnacalcarata]|uniref:Periodic tryptophan protein 1 n=2 Tax=Rotaria magnacalcarata TaxID=392030 RepID=A0A816GE15_9BILA|nr:unnamed protein product [Rotaria magnacalcarata]CAF1673526.1 unnamed protein product [Rotaria magnacalcarata]CAF1982427.1 unnamed protein product [Rotaria magnacalcarata]